MDHAPQTRSSDSYRTTGPSTHKAPAASLRVPPHVPNTGFRGDPFRRLRRAMQNLALTRRPSEPSVGLTAFTTAGLSARCASTGT